MSKKMLATGKVLKDISSDVGEKLFDFQKDGHDLDGALKRLKVGSSLSEVVETMIY